MVASLDTEIGGFNCLNPAEGHQRDKFVLEAQSAKGCVDSTEDKASSTKIDTWAEGEFVNYNFPEVFLIGGIASSLTDDIDLYARTVLNTNGVNACSKIDTQELETSSTELSKYVDDTQSRFKLMS